MVSEAVIEAALKDTVSQNFHFPGFVTLLRAKINFRYYLPILFFLVANFLLQFIHACVFRAGSFKNEEEFFFTKQIHITMKKENKNGLLIILI